jgi:hypothetical protein
MPQILLSKLTGFRERLSAPDQIPAWTIGEHIDPKCRDCVGNGASREEAFIQCRQEENAKPVEGEKGREMQRGIVSNRVEEKDGIIPEGMAINLWNLFNFVWQIFIYLFCAKNCKFWLALSYESSICKFAFSHTI